MVRAWAFIRTDVQLIIFDPGHLLKNIVIRLGLIVSCEGCVIKKQSQVRGATMKNNIRHVTLDKLLYKGCGIPPHARRVAFFSVSNK